ncbi:hypothetical protein VTK73DRAFT_10279 [Phialemonium thermophilum]|uniref:UBX domain-containing protein 2 n=1 Tax=Phialemonium thermophilum TaxID=223376 RepID=A0ABR3XHI1_9PEZI
MFFQGTLQEGIASAIQQAKSVVCFVTDEQEESQAWETDFLAEESLRESLQQRAVCLRLKAGSTEAGYLAAIYPLPKVPTLVVIKNGQLKEYIVSGVSKSEFVARARKAVDEQAVPPVVGSSSALSSSQAQAATQPTGHSPAESGAQVTPSPTAEPESGTVQNLLAERAARLEAQRKKEAEEAKRRRAEKAAQAKAEAEAVEKGQRPKPTDSQSVHAELLKRKQREAREERQRILKAIEDDKAARRARQAEREAEKKLAVASGSSSGKAMSGGASDGPVPLSKLPSTARGSEHCAVQVRLFDGSTIRNRFPNDARLGSDVRKWVESTRRDGGYPFTFKVLLTPLPSRNIELSEEDQTLQELGLTPSSTLILVPRARASKVAAAYPEADGNIVSRFFLFILSFFTGFFSLIRSFFSSLFSTSGPQQEPEQPGPRGGQAVASGRDDGRIKTLGETREGRDDQQFYNGNSTNFEPRKDDKDE